jgi:hypothetical protein
MITRPGRAPRPARPATWVRSWKVRSAGAEVGQPEREIGAQHADQRHAGEVVALGDHLRADEHVDLAPRTRASTASAGAAGDVAIEARDPRAREALGERRRDSLGAQALAIDRSAPHLAQRSGTRSRGRSSDSAADPTAW